ncbi:hypothetical protein T06_11214 [Trichinella sp. T6]|nr:hypothetical protein T06_11214 [Trichinella sp. T6]
MRLFLNRRSVRRLHKRNRFNPMFVSQLKFTFSLFLLHHLLVTKSNKSGDENFKLWKALTNQIDQNEIFSRPALLGTAVLLASKAPQLHIQSWICNDDDNDVSRPLGALFQL